MTSRPSATAGEPVKPPPSSISDAWEPSDAFNTYSRPVLSATKTLEFEITGDASTLPRAVNSQTFSPLFESRP